MAGVLSYFMTLTTSAFTAPLNAAGGAVRGFSGYLEGLASKLTSLPSLMAGAAAVAGSLGMAFKAIKLSADMESTEVAFSTLMGSSEKARALMADLNREAASTPFQFEELAQASRKLLAVSGEKNLISDMRMIGDLAAASQKPIGDLASMYAKIKGGDIVQAEDLNMIGDALGGKALEEFAKVLGVDSIRAVRQLGSEGKITGADLEKVFRNLTSEGGMAFNAMAAQSATTNGLLSTLKDNINAILRTIGTPLNDAIRPLLQDAIGLAQRVGQGIQAAVALAKDAIANGRLGELLGLSLRAGFGIGADFGLRTLQFVAEGFGKALVWVFESSVGFFTNLLSGGFNTFFAGLGDSFLGVGRLILASIGGPFRDIVAGFQAGLAVAIDTVMAGLAKIPFLGEKVGTGWGGLTFEGAKADILGDLDSGKELSEAKKQIKDGVEAMFPGTGGSALDELARQLREKLPGLSESLADQLGDAGESMADALKEQSDKIEEAGAATAAALAPPKDAEQSRRRGVRNPFETLMAQFERDARRGRLGTGDATDMMERFLAVSPSRRSLVEQASGFKGVATPTAGGSLHHLAADALRLPFDGLATAADALNRANAAADPRPARGTPAADPARQHTTAMLRVVEEIRDLFANLATA